MSTTRTTLTTLFLLASTAQTLAVDPARGAMVPVPPTEGRYGHWLYLPREVFKPEAKIPALLYLHGSSSRGNDLNRLLRQGPPKHIRAGQHFPFILVAAQAPAGTNWDPAKLKALMDWLQTQHPIDPDRIYLTGLSRGGRGTYRTAAAYPNYFAAIAPTAPWAIDLDWAPKLAKVPVWAFHGDQDRVASFADGKEMVRRIRATGGHARFTVYEGHDHGAKNGWDPAYADPKLYAWLLAQHRKKPVAYALIVEGGSGSGFYRRDTKLQIHAHPKAGHRFNRWVIQGAGDLEKPNKQATVFVMPDRDARITANWTSSP